MVTATNSPHAFQSLLKWLRSNELGAAVLTNKKPNEPGTSGNLQRYADELRDRLGEMSEWNDDVEHKCDLSQQKEDRDRASSDLSSKKEPPRSVAYG